MKIFLANLGVKNYNLTRNLPLRLKYEKSNYQYYVISLVVQIARLRTFKKT